jgi:protein SSD1
MPSAKDGESSTLSNIQKVISDMKSIPATSAQSQGPGQGPNQPQTQSQATNNNQQAPTYAQTTQSNLTPTAAPFQPSFVPGEVPPRHRKAQSMGPTPAGAASTGNYSMNQYAPYLDSMSEDVETSASESLPPMAQFSNRQPMGSFQAPRFSSMSQAGINEQDYVGPSGRPQLAPSFSFGAKRRTNSLSVGPGPAIGEEDAGFQFPQQNQQPQQQVYHSNDNQSQGINSHRRTGSEISGIMSQQIAIQNQIEALQQQQQQLLQQQLASNQVGIL